MWFRGLQLFLCDKRAAIVRRSCAAIEHARCHRLRLGSRHQIHRLAFVHKSIRPSENFNALPCRRPHRLLGPVPSDIRHTLSECGVPSCSGWPVVVAAKRGNPVSGGGGGNGRHGSCSGVGGGWRRAGPGLRRRGGPEKRTDVRQRMLLVVVRAQGCMTVCCSLVLSNLRNRLRQDGPSEEALLQRRRPGRRRRGGGSALTACWCGGKPWHLLLLPRPSLSCCCWVRRAAAFRHTHFVAFGRWHARGLPRQAFQARKGRGEERVVIAGGWGDQRERPAKSHCVACNARDEFCVVQVGIVYYPQLHCFSLAAEIYTEMAQAVRSSPNSLPKFGMHLRLSTPLVDGSPESPVP